MWAYTLRRLFYAVPILLGVSMLVFALIHLAPGDVVDLLVPPEVPREVADSLRARFALDQPVYIQYCAWLGRLLRGELDGRVQRHASGAGETGALADRF